MDIIVLKICILVFGSGLYINCSRTIQILLHYSVYYTFVQSCVIINYCSLANYPEEVINSLPEGLDTGVYYGWASLDGNEVYKMVLSVGWNPFFKNTKKSMVGEGIDHQTTCFLDCLWLKYETIGR